MALFYHHQTCLKIGASGPSPQDGKVTVLKDKLTLQKDEARLGRWRLRDKFSPWEVSSVTVSGRNSETVKMHLPGLVYKGKFTGKPDRLRFSLQSSENQHEPASRQIRPIPICRLPRRRTLWLGIGLQTCSESAKQRIASCFYDILWYFMVNFRGIIPKWPNISG